MRWCARACTRRRWDGLPSCWRAERLLFAYGCMVNSPPWDFGRLLGVYVVFFFVVAQAIAWLAFGQRPDGRLMLGGALIVIGGLIVSGAQA